MKQLVVMTIMSSAASLKVKNYLPWAFLSIIPFLLFFRVIFFDFVALDDELLIVDNPTIRGISVPNIVQAFTTFDPELYVPVTLLSHQIEYSVFGLHPTVYHAVNLLLHIGSGLVLFQILKRFFRGRAPFLLSLLFLVHPLQVEAVAWAAARKDLLAGFFFLSSLLWYLRFKERGRGYRVSVGLFLLGLLSKVSVAPLPLLLVILDLFEGRIMWREKMPYIVLSAVFIIVAMVGKAGQMGDLLTPLLLAFVAVPHYLFKLVLPLNLSVLYPFVEQVSIANTQILIGFFIVVALSIGAWVLRKRMPIVGVAWVLFLLLLAPSFLNVAKGESLYFASDRYMYLPIVAILIMVGTLVREKLSEVVLIIAVIACSILTMLHLPTWKSSEALFSQVIAAGYPSHLAISNLAGLRLKKGELEEAALLYEQSLAIQETAETYFNVGQLLSAQGRLDQATEAFRKAVAITPMDAQLHAKIGSLLLMRGQIDAAYQSLREADRLDPNQASVQYNLGLIYEHNGEIVEAERRYRRVLELRPDDPQARKKLEL